MRRPGLLLILLGACGGGGGDSPDGHVVPPIDAEVPDALAETVTVIATSHCCASPVDEPAEGVSVLVAGATALTDADGEAVLPVTPGDSVTVVYPVDAEMQTYVYTMMGVQPDDFIRTGDKFNDLSTVTATATAEWTAQVGQDQYLFNDGCTSDLIADTGTSAAVKQYAGGCAKETTDVLVVARAGTTPLTWSYVGDVDVVDAATITMPAFAPATTFTLDVTGIDAAVDDVQATATPRIGQSFGQAVQAQGAPVAGAFAATGPWTAAHVIELEANLTSAAHTGLQHIHHYVDGSATSGSLTGSTLPWVDGVTVDIANRTVSWTESNSGVYDAIVVELQWGDVLFKGGTVPSYRWRIVAPPGVSSITWTDLPAALDGAEPTPTDTIFTTVQLVDFTEIVDYETIRGMHEAELTRTTNLATQNQRDVQISQN